MIRSFCLAFVHALLVLQLSSAFNSAIGQEAGRNAETSSEKSTDIAGVQQQLRSLKQTQDEIQQALQRIEARIGELQRQPSEFSHVIIHIETSDGEPIEGYDVHLFSERDEGHKARAKGASDTDGKALDRYMPYGDYSLRVGGFGWSTYFRDLHVELQSPLELTVVAPDPKAMGKLELDVALRRKAFATLPFGTVTESRGRGYTWDFLPEPGEIDAKMRTFPRLGNGITTVGVDVKFTATASLEQPDGEMQEWDWTPEVSLASMRYLLATPEGFKQFDSSESMRKTPRSDAEFYSSLDDEQSILLNVMEPVKSFDSPLTLQCPTGEVDVSVNGIMGRASPKLVDAILDKSELKNRSVWLPLKLRDDSEWLPRLFELDGWRPSDNIRWVLKRTVEVKRGQTTRIRLASGR